MAEQSGCCGGSDVEASDRACRQLMSEGLGVMFCLAGLGAGIEPMIDQARAARNVVIDGCPMDCARKVFEALGVDDVHFVRVTDIGLAKKAKGVRATDEEVRTIVENVRRVLAG